MKKMYLKAVAVGIAAILVMGTVLAFAMFMADRDMKEYYKEPRTYDNDFVGVGWYALFGVSTFLIMFLAGLFSARWTANEARSMKETTVVAAIAAFIPLIGILLLLMAAGFLLVLSSSPGSIGYLSLYTLSPVAQLSTCCLAYAFIAIALSIAGGLAYRLLLKDIHWVSIGRAFKSRAVVPGIVGGALAFAVCIGAYYLTGFSMAVLFLQALLFTLISLAAGMISGFASARRGDALKAAVGSSAIAGLIVGMGYGFGLFMVAVLKRYDELGILIMYGLPGLLDGIVLGLIGGFLVYILRNERRQYVNAAKVGAVAGALIAVIVLVPGILDLLTSNTGPGSIFSMLWLALGSMFSLVIYIIVAFAGALAVKYSRVKDLGQAMAAACLCGTVAVLFMAVVDAIMVLLRYVRYGMPAENSMGMDFIVETLSANYNSFLQGEPFKMLFVIGIAVFCGIVYGIWALNLRSPGGNGGMAAAEK